MEVRKYNTMADQRFFHRHKPITLEEIARVANAEIVNLACAKQKFEDVAALDIANVNHVSFLDNKKYLHEFEKTEAGACFVHPDLAKHAPDNTICLLSKNPYKSYALAAQQFYPEKKVEKTSYHKKSIIDDTAIFGEACIVEAGAVIGKHVKIGDNCIVGANSVIGEFVEIGDNCTIGMNASLSHCLLGNNIEIYAGACIGQRGFGFAIDSSGFTTVPQLGRVIIEDNVEVGANSTIDRGAGPDTVIGAGTRIDNLVQIGHNVKIGRNCVIVAQTGISGSTEFGDFVMAGGQSGFAGHLKIGSGVRIAAQSGIMRDIPAGQAEYMGSPAIPLKQYMRQVAALSRLIKQKSK